MVLSTEERKFLDENFERARRNFFSARNSVYNTLLVVTTGTFVLSISFLTAFASSPFIWGPALELSWTCMALSIATYLAFLHHDAEAEGSVIDELRENMSADNLPKSYSPGQTKRTQMFYKRSNNFLYMTYVFAGIGMIFFLLFGLANFAARSNPQFQQEYQGYIMSQHHYRN